MTIRFTLATLAMMGCTTGWTGAPEPADVGEPVGEAVEAVIGEDGGRLQSADGRFTLEVPEGALSEDTALTVQGITNTAWGGFGDGYRLTPALAFDSPVTVSLAYDDQDRVGTADDALGIAAQDGDGYWNALPNGAVDGGVLVVETTDLTERTDLAAHWRVRIDPPESTVGLGAQLELALVASAAVLDWPTTEIVLGPPSPWTHPSPVTWAVSGSPTGEVTGDASGAIYVAPSSPDAIGATNVVTASLDGVDLAAVVHIDQPVTPPATTLPGGDDLPASWVGYSRVYGPGFSYATDIVWSLSDRQGDVYTYSATGHITVMVETSGCHWDPLEYDLSPGEGTLVVDDSTLPATYSGHGVTVWTMTISCPGVGDVVTPFPIVWFGDAADTLPTLGQVKFEEGRRIIEDEHPVEEGTIYWRFEEQ